MARNKNNKFYRFLRLLMLKIGKKIIKIHDMSEEKMFYFVRHKNLKKRTSRCFKATTNTSSQRTDSRAQHYIKMHKTSPCITTLTLTTAGLLIPDNSTQLRVVQAMYQEAKFRQRKKRKFAAYGFVQEKHRNISLMSCLRSRYRCTRERKGKMFRNERMVFQFS